MLDMGCGAGHASFAAAGQVAQVTAYDLSSQMLEVVAQAARDKGFANIATQQGYAESLPFADASFDVAISRYSAHHWHDVGQALREVKRVLKPGGVMIIMDVMSPGHPIRDVWLQTVEALRDTSHVRNFSSGEWLTMASEAGLLINHLLTDRLPLEFSSWVARDADASGADGSDSFISGERIGGGQSLFCIAAGWFFHQRYDYV